MELADLQQRVLDTYGLRVEPEMGRYLLRKLSEPGSASSELAVIGGHARTGTPMRQKIDPQLLLRSSASSSQPQPSLFPQ